MSLVSQNPTLAWLEDLAVARDYISTVLSLLAIAACGALLLTFGVFRSLRTFVVKLVCYLALCIMVALGSYLLAFELANTPLCIPLAVLVHFSFLCNFSWALCIAVNFYLMIVQRSADCERFERWYHLVAWLPPAIIVIGTGAAELYGGLGSVMLVTGEERFTVCYIRSIDAVFFGLTLPGVIVVTLNATLFFFVAREIRATMRSNNEAAGTAGTAGKRRRHFRVYTSIFVSVGLPWVIGFMSYFAPKLDDYRRAPNDVSEAGVIVGELLSLLFNIAVPLQGLLLFESYCLNGKVLDKWSQLLGTCVPCVKRFRTVKSSIDA